MKKFLIVYHGDAPVCVEGFPEGCERSVKGALHIYPGKQATVTEGEYEHVKKAHAYMVPKLRLISTQKAVVAKAEELVAPVLEEKAELVEDKSGTNKGSKGKKS